MVNHPSPISTLNSVQGRSVTKSKLKNMALIIGLNALIYFLFGQIVRGSGPTNLLFIIYDDLRPELSIYGQSHMITPNFERLAQKSVVFDNAYCQIAVCNPSRDSLLTGLRPDTLRTFGFDNTYAPHLIFPTRLKNQGYTTMGIGKIAHWDSINQEVWSEQYMDEQEWYGYQNLEQELLNSTVMPDKIKPEEDFPDYRIASKAIEKLIEYSSSGQSFVIAAGFKMPHTALHVPFSMFEMYRQLHTQGQWNVPAEQRTFPPSAPIQGYRCCTETQYRYMDHEGSLPSENRLPIGQVAEPMPVEMYAEMMWGYSAAISFVDKQLGRILDTLDERSLWNNLTVILTADHGMHNGEKGIWEKWTLFDEATHVPLLIHHPQSPFAGKRYRGPVELLDIFPTVNDLVINKPLGDANSIDYALPGSSYVRKYVPLAGKSLAPVILGERAGDDSPKPSSSGVAGNNYLDLVKSVKARSQPLATPQMANLSQKFAISQVLLCAPTYFMDFDPRSSLSVVAHQSFLDNHSTFDYQPTFWRDCDRNKDLSGTTMVMGYSMRAVDYRYTAWLELDKTSLIPLWDNAPLAEQLYEHTSHDSSHFAHVELENLSLQDKYQEQTARYREVLLDFLQSQVLYQANMGDRRKRKFLKFDEEGDALTNDPAKDQERAQKRRIRQEKRRSARNNQLNNASNDPSASGNTNFAPTNLLFIMYDDLRPELNCYGKYHMKTPHFDRLAKKSVLFELAVVQVAVCNPSRNSLLTGLRPDTISSLGFESDYEPYLLLPTLMKRSGYTTEGIGKIRHWDDEGDTNVWSTNFHNNWYDYQDKEWNSMISTVMPDKKKDESTFPDYVFASRAIESLKKYNERKESFMLAVGFKMPHTCLHVPFEAFDMYRDISPYQWQLSPQELTFPPTAALPGYRCCADTRYRYMNHEGDEPSIRSTPLGSPNDPIPVDMYAEMMWGYSAAVSFVDKQLGRILDTLDELEMWNNLTVILTADHGMHNGEKGMWEKWTLFDEATRVPLLIHHPRSPFAGKRYRGPVELLDIFPTVVDLVAPPMSQQQIYNTNSLDTTISERKYMPLQGQSLVPVIMGKMTDGGVRMPKLNKTFAVSQIIKCASKDQLRKEAGRQKRTQRRTGADRLQVHHPPEALPVGVWGDCDIRNASITTEIMVMGYSMRTRDYRYNAYIPLDRAKLAPDWANLAGRTKLLYEELYDHRNEVLSELTRRELHNLVWDDEYTNVVKEHRAQLLSFLQNDVIYHRLQPDYTP